MRLNLRNLLLSNTTIKISSIIIGFIAWSILNESYRAHLTLAVPVCFYNAPEAGSIISAEQLYVTLAGSHTSVRNLDQKTLAAHIDAQQLAEGKHVVAVTAKNLLLPPEVSLVKYKPIEVTHNTAEA